MGERKENLKFNSGEEIKPFTEYLIRHENRRVRR
jgi:hypothetical protein